MEDRYWTMKEKRTWMWALFTSCLALYAARMTMPITVPMISEQYKWSKTESGTVLSCFFWGYALSQVLGGYLSDNIGGEVVLLMSISGWSLLTFFTPECIMQDKQASLWLLSFVRIVFGALQGVHFPAIASIVAKNLHISEKTFFNSVVSAGPALGMLFSGSVGSYVVDTYGWNYIYRLTGLVGLSWVLIIKLRVLERKPDISLQGKDTSQSFKSVPWKTFFKSPAFWSMLFCHFTHNNFFFILLSWLPTYFKEQFPDEKGWVFNVVPWILCPITSIAGGWLAENLMKKGWKVGRVRKLLEMLSELNSAILLAAFTCTSSYVGALLCLATAMAASGFHTSGVFINPQDLAPDNAGSVLGIMNAVGALPGFIGVYIAGYILDVWKSWTIVFLLTSLFSVAGCLSFVVFGTGKSLISDSPTKP